MTKTSDHIPDKPSEDVLMCVSGERHSDVRQMFRSQMKLLITCTTRQVSTELEQTDTDTHDLYQTIKSPQCAGRAAEDASTMMIKMKMMISQLLNVFSSYTDVTDVNVMSLQGSKLKLYFLCNVCSSTAVYYRTACVMCAVVLQYITVLPV